MGECYFEQACLSVLEFGPRFGLETLRINVSQLNGTVQMSNVKQLINLESVNYPLFCPLFIGSVSFDAVCSHSVEQIEVELECVIAVRFNRIDQPLQY